jgi:hypothetical protein
LTVANGEQPASDRRVTEQQANSPAALIPEKLIGKQALN